jgi:hypothetical protein
VREVGREARSSKTRGRTGRIARTKGFKGKGKGKAVEKRMCTLSEGVVTLEELSKYFHMHVQAVAKELGISLASLRSSACLTESRAGLSESSSQSSAQKGRHNVGREWAGWGQEEAL